VRWDQFRGILIFEWLYVVLKKSRRRTVNVARRSRFCWRLTTHIHHLPEDSLIVSRNMSDMTVRRGLIAF